MVWNLSANTLRTALTPEGLMVRAMSTMIPCVYERLKAHDWEQGSAQVSLRSFVLPV